MIELFYIQDSRSYVGNDVLWWGLKGNGYTTDLDRAQTYTKDEAIKMNQSRYTDIPWPKDYIDAKWRKAVDIQYIHNNDAFDISGIKLQKPPKIKKEKIHCNGCGRFLETMYCDCPSCGSSNWP